MASKMNDQQYSFDQVVERYLQLRAEKKVAEDRLKSEVADFDKKLDVIESYILGQLTTMGVESMRTKAGTCYKHLKTNVSVADKEVFRQYIEKTGDLSLMNVTANKTRVLEVLETDGVLVPGLNMHRTVTVGIRKGTSVGS